MPKYKAPVDVSQAVTGESVSSSAVGLTKFHTVRIRQDAIPSENRGAVTVKCHMPEEISLDTTAQYNTPFADLIQANPIQAALLSAAGYFPLTQAMTTQFWSGSAPIQLTLPLTIIAWAKSDEITRNVLLLKSLQVPRTNKKTKTLIPPGPRIEPSEKFWDGAGKLLETSFGAVTDVLNFAANQAENVLEVGANAVADVQEGKASVKNAVKKAATEAGKDVIDGAKGALDSLAKRIGDVHTTVESMFKVTGKISIKIGEFLYFDDVIIEHVSDAYNVVLGPDGRPQKCQVTIQATTRVTPSYEDLVGTRGIYQYPDPLKNVGTSKTKDSTTDPHKAHGHQAKKGGSQKTKQKGRSPSVKSATSKHRKVSRPATVKKG
jgi:hypothetical protein